MTLACSSSYGAGSCSISPTSVSSFPATATLTINGTSFTSGGAYSVSVSGTSGSNVHSLMVPFNVGDYSISGAQSVSTIAAQQAEATLQLSSQYSYAARINASCDASTIPGAMCTLNPPNPISVASGASVTLTVTINIPNDASPGAYAIRVNTQDTTGVLSHTFSVSVQVGDYSVSGTQTISGTPGAQLTANFQISSLFGYGGKIKATCDATTLAGAMCTLTPSNPISVPSGGSASLAATINIPNDASPGVYTIKINTQDTTKTLNHSANIALTEAQDFRVTSSTTSQTVIAGQTSGPYALAVQPVGSSFTAAVTLTCTEGLPAGAQCIFSPSTPVTPGDSAADVVMNISTKASARSRTLGQFPPPTIWIALAATVLGMSAFANRGPRRASRAFTLCLAMMVIASCAGVSSGGSGGGGQPPPPATYHITVTGTSPGTLTSTGHSTTVTLIVN